MPVSTDMMVRVSHADIALHMAFPRSVAHWQGRKNRERPWKVFGGNCGAILIGKEDGVLIDGDCSNHVAAPEGGVVHVNGSFGSQMELGGHFEVVITGDVLPGALIQASGFCHVFVGGKFSGDIRSSGSTKLWIESDFDGSLKTGNPVTEVHIGNDCHGTISPHGDAALLYLTVDGFTPSEFLTAMLNCGYTQFNASIARSDVPPGIYPANGHVRKTAGGNSFNRWCVRSQPIDGRGE